MHFYYLDESGCTGGNLTDANQPIFVLGGLSVRDEGWNATQEQFHKLIDAFFGDAIPPNFELHATQLLSYNGDGTFAGFTQQQRMKLASDILRLIVTRKHDTHFIAIDKDKLSRETRIPNLPYDTGHPYPLTFDYIIHYVHELIRKHLGRSARGMIILDRKDQYEHEVEATISFRRYGVKKQDRIIRIVEFASPVDSHKNPFIQISDLITFIVRKFLAMDLGYINASSQLWEKFYALSYHQLSERLWRKTLVTIPGKTMANLNAHLKKVQALPQRQWKKQYGI